MSDASWELQKAIYDELTSDSPVSIAAGRIYDQVPDSSSGASAPDAQFPYVQIGEMDSIPDDVGAGDGRDDGEIETLTLHVWSRHRGSKEVKQIMQQVKDRLHDTSVTVLDRESAICWVRSRRSFMDPDGRTRHGVIQIEIRHRGDVVMELREDGGVELRE